MGNARCHLMKLRQIRDGLKQELYMSSIATIILAAGKGTRMKSERAKVLHQICGLPLVSYPLALAGELGSAVTAVVVGHQQEDVEAAVDRTADGQTVVFAHQTEQRGTGHAVMTGMAALPDFHGQVFILSGDVPLLTKRTLLQLDQAYRDAGGPMAFVTFCPQDAGSYGRVIRDDRQRPVAIREFRDCTDAQKRIREVNAGIYLVDADFLRTSVSELKADNAQGELYLTDLVEMASASAQVATVETAPEEVAGVNDRFDLLTIEQTLQKEINNRWMAAGVTIQSPDTVHIDMHCEIGADTRISAGVHLQGTTRIGPGCIVEPGAVIRDSVIAADVVIKAYSVVENAIVDRYATVGPMARLRPGAHLLENAHVGNWVELKNTVLGEGSKANHLAYLGDGVIGRNVNIGAGCIFCNYDGFLKHRTTIEDNVFVGSDSQMVAPVIIREGAYIATGTTVTHEVPANGLAISRGRQINKPGLGEQLRERLRKARDKFKKEMRI
jgi:bifunctional UDP-N-acetylglucosamine pyrophosphorylase / glucosamine-1-phosphate N-acetyltransferase